MKYYIIIVLASFQSIMVSAQNIDYNKIVLPDQVKPSSFEERLVQLAWKNHPSNKIALQNVEIARKEKKIAQWKWLDDIYANGNLNEYTINPAPNTSSNVFFPRYNFGIRVSLGTFVSTPLHSKIASDQIINSENQVNERKLVVREDVLSNFEKLKQYYKFMKLREQIKEDFLVMYKDSEKKFSTGEIDIEKYRTAVQGYYGQAEKVVEAQANFLNSKITLEALVGIDLVDIEGYQEFLRKLDSEIRID
jgi:outer membrane protein TolC